MYLKCSNEHEISKTKVSQCIQKCCRNCVRILCFSQIEGYLYEYYYHDSNSSNIYTKVIKSKKHCQLCGKSLFQSTHIWQPTIICKRNVWRPILCSNCYLISFEWTESTLSKKQISLLYLPWWYDNSHCDVCYSDLTFTTDCQKRT
ncbi:kinase-like domain-containing protein [Rhizophagus irregularis DAOM 181602=DAOM 197198]|nr:kinase-like domain-containing protein [Rhizophagus irregularis DAOM 181602=DAOM 197198]